MTCRAINGLLPLFAAILVFAGPAFAQIRYVDDDGPPGGDGLTWSTAYRFLQDGLAQANTPGSSITEVRVAQGLYFTDQSEADPDGTDDIFATYLIAQPFALRGGYAGIGAPDPDARDFELYESILIGEIGSFTTVTDNSRHVVTASVDSLLEGFTIRDGYASGARPLDDHGAGLLVLSDAFIVQSCTFADNQSFSGGGALWADDCALTLNGCSFIGNQSSAGGGAVRTSDCSLTLSGCNFIDNGGTLFGTGSGGSAIDLTGGSIVMTGCFFEGNYLGTASVYAENAVLELADSELSTIYAYPALATTNCSITLTGSQVNTSIEFSGGTISAAGALFAGFFASIQGSNGGVTLVDTVFENAYTPLTLEQCDVTGTSCEFRSSFSMALDSCEIVFTNCSFVDNGGGDFGGAIYSLDSNLTLLECDFLLTRTGFTGANVGGFVASTHGTLSATDCTFTSASVEHFAAYLAGGAVWVDAPDVPPVFTNCTFTRMRSRESGGAVLVRQFNEPEGAVIFEQCVFQDCAAAESLPPYNVPLSRGGAIAVYPGNLTLTDCSFTGNAARQSGAVEFGATEQQGQLRIMNCIFERNLANGTGALGVLQNANAIVQNCSFRANFGGGCAGLTVAHGAYVRVEQCEFLGNMAVLGGALSAQQSGATMECVNCTFSGNSVIGTGPAGHGGVAWLHGGSISFTNCTLTASSAEEAGSIAYLFDDAAVSFDNCILWNNSDPQGSDEDSLFDIVANSSAQISYSIVDGLTGTYSGVGNIDANPMFISEPNGGDDGFGDNPDTLDVDESANDDYGNLHMMLTSPAIDAGWNNAVPLDVHDLDMDGDVNEFVPFDLDGLPRFAQVAEAPDIGCGIGAIVDMGAYEFQGVPGVQPVYGDVDGDQQLDISDLISILNAWGECLDDCCVEDINADGVIDIDDLLTALGVW